MAAQDRFYYCVEAALQKNGWSNIAPLPLRYGADRLEIDLAAEQVLAAQQGAVQIAVEVKSFIAASVVYEFHQAVGQYLHYRLALEHNRLKNKLYLAVPETIYQQHFVKLLFQDSIQVHKVQIIIVDEQQQEILQWNPNPFQ